MSNVSVLRGKKHTHYDW